MLTKAECVIPDMMQMIKLPFSLLDAFHLVELRLKSEMERGRNKLKIVY